MTRLTRWLLLILGAVGAGLFTVALLDSPALAHPQQSSALSVEPDATPAPTVDATRIVDVLLGRLPAAPTPIAEPATPTPPPATAEPAEVRRPEALPTPDGDSDGPPPPSAGDVPPGPRLAPTAGRSPRPVATASGGTRTGTGARPPHLMTAVTRTVELVPATVAGLSTVVVGITPEPLRIPVENLLAPVVEVTDDLIGLLLPGTSCCPVERVPAQSPVPVTEPAHTDDPGAAGPETAAGHAPAAARATARGQSPPSARTVGQLSSGIRTHSPADVRLADPASPDTLSGSGVASGDRVLTADRNAGPGPLAHRGSGWPLEPGSSGPVAHRSAFVTGLSSAVVARPG